MDPKLTWSFEPGIVAMILFALTLYVWRWTAVRRKHGAKDAGTGRLALFLLGAAFLTLALCSPIDTLADQVIFIHMIQHVIILDFVPILMIVALTKVILRPVAKPLFQIERSLGPLATPAFAAILYCSAMWIWHIPDLYDAAIEHTAVHIFEHMCFGVAGFLYWWHLLSPIRSRFRFGGPAPVIYMLSTKIVLGMLGIALTFSPDLLYPAYADAPRYWGLDPLEDQNIAGLVMALEQSIVMGVALTVLFIRWLAESEKEAEREERYEDS